MVDSPPPDHLSIAFCITSLGKLLYLALSSAAASDGFILGSAHHLAAITMILAILVYVLDFLASVAAFLCLILCRLLCQAMCDFVKFVKSDRVLEE